MKGFLTRTCYYVKRCGCGYLVDLLRRKGRSQSTNRKLYNYFESLPKSQYQTELKKYLTVFAENGEQYDLEHPRTFNEKIQWLKLHDTTPLKTRLADKFEVREWIIEQIGEEYLIPVVGGPWKSGQDIDFSTLPEQFALKANHGSGMNLIVKDKQKLDFTEAARKADIWMQTMYGWNGLEIQYFDIPRLIYAEQYIEQSNGDLVDYKFHCFNGNPYVLQIIGDRDLKTHTGHEAFVDMDWKPRQVGKQSYQQYESLPPKPDVFEQMKELAAKLSQGFKYVRVDLYIVNGRVYFGEMTFTPANGIEPWGEDFQIELGDLIDTDI